MQKHHTLIAGISIALVLGSLSRSFAEECCGGSILQEHEECCNDQPYEPSALVACCNDEGTYNLDIINESYSVDISGVDGSIKGKINALLNKIPGAPNVTVTSAGLHGSYAQNDCCPPSSEGPKTHGKKEFNGGLTFSAALDHHLVWPAIPSELREATINLGGASVKVKAELGVFLSVSVGVEGTVGHKSNECDPGDTCSYGSVQISLGPQLDIGAEAEACFRMSDNEVCAGFSITPVSAACGISLTGGYNMGGDCSAGWTGSGSISAFSVKTNVSAWGFGGTITWYTFNGGMV
jgi:hypothetical protein